MAKSLNGTEYEVTGAQWAERAESAYLGGNVPTNRWKLHTWQLSAVLDTVYEAFYALEGSLVTLTTTGYDTRNTDATYYGVEIKAVRGEHTGPSFENVEIEFLVRV